MTHGGKREGAGRPETPEEDKRKVYTVRLPQWLILELRATPDAGKAVELALIDAGFKKIKLDSNEKQTSYK